MKHSMMAIALAVVLALPMPATALAADTSPATTESQAVQGYLGVTIGRLPDSVRAQLPAAIPPQQGILVEQVMQGSPAEKAGLQPFDILLQYNDQKLFSPEQLTSLVGSGTSGQVVQLTLVRGGDVSMLEVKLGERSLSESVPPLSRPGMRPPPFHGYHQHSFAGPGQQSLQDTEKNWESFDALSLDKVKGDQYKAVIGYLAKDGSHKHLEFTGNREEIRQQILAQKDLPDRERDQLLGALSARDDIFPFGYRPAMPSDQDFPWPPSWWGWHSDPRRPM